MGRPPHEPTAATRKKVSIAAGSGRMSHEEIAIALGISRNTLEKHYEVELSEGALKRRLEVLSAQHKAALKGNVSAQKAYLDNPSLLAVPPAEPEKPAKDDDAPKLGKKEQQHQDALVAVKGTEWADVLPRNTSH